MSDVRCVFEASSHEPVCLSVSSDGTRVSSSAQLRVFFVLRSA